MFRGGPFGMGEGVPPFFGGAGIGGNFRQQYRCYSVAMSPATNPQGLEEGGKIIMPPSALSELTRLNIQYPMLFKLTSSRSKATHCGVLEFVAEEGKIYIPHWMMNNIYIQEGDLVWVENVTLPLATFAKFQPQTVDFLDITDPKAVLELKLRHFACLTKGDMIAVHYNNKIYELLVLDTQPERAMSIIECDMQVDFAPPVGYKPPPTPEPKIEEIDSPLDLSSVPSELMDFTAWGHTTLAAELLSVARRLLRVEVPLITVCCLVPSEPFGGSGQRLDGKKKKVPGKGKTSSSTDAGAVSQATYRRGIPHYDYKVGKLKFFSAKSLEAMVKKREDEKKAELSEFTPFEGGGKQLKPRKRPA